MAKASWEDARGLAALSSDCSFLLSHLIRCKGDAKRTSEWARNTLRLILGLDSGSQAPRLRGSGAGWYSSRGAYVLDHLSGSWKAAKTPTNVVCFTESTLQGLKAHRDVFEAEYGLAFDRDFMFTRDANPCLNVREDLLKKEMKRKGDKARKLYNFVPIPLIPYVNIMNEAFDATHEREWRIKNDFEFRYSDLLFVFCPEHDFPSFSVIQSQGRPALFDLTWLDRL